MTEINYYHEMYSRLVDEFKALYKSNLKRIHKGLWAMIIVVILYMVLLFVTQGEKTLILLLWIVTMFALAAYLITIEYLNEELKKKLELITQQEHDFGPEAADVIAEEELLKLREILASPPPIPSISEAIAARRGAAAEKAKAESADAEIEKPAPAETAKAGTADEENGADRAAAEEEKAPEKAAEASPAPVVSEEQTETVTEAPEKVEESVKAEAEAAPDTAPEHDAAAGAASESGEEVCV